MSKSKGPKPKRNASLKWGEIPQKGKGALNSIPTFAILSNVRLQFGDNWKYRVIPYDSNGNNANKTYDNIDVNAIIQDIIAKLQPHQIENIIMESKIKLKWSYFMDNCPQAKSVENDKMFKDKLLKIYGDLDELLNKWKRKKSFKSLDNIDNAYKIKQSKANKDRRRRFAQLSLDENDDDSLPATKRQKVNPKDDYNDSDDTPSTLTIPLCCDRKKPLAYTPFWICGNSTKTVLQDPHRDCHRYVLYAPAEFLNATQYPFVRVCDIPKNRILALNPQNFGDDFYSGDIYEYSHPLSLKHQTSTNDLTQFINCKVEAFHTFQQKKEGWNTNVYHDDNEHLFTYLFIMKEHYANFYNEIVSNNKSSLLQMLTDDIIQFTLTDFIYETRVAKDIHYLNDHRKIDQHKWFQFAFHFIEFAAKEWQEFFYQTLLHNNSKYYEIIINAMQRNAFMGCRLFQCAKLVEFCIKIYPQTGNNFLPPEIIDFVIHSIKLNDADLFKIALDLFDSMSVSGFFWGSLLFEAVSNIKCESLLTFLNEICNKMKVHCNEYKIKDSLNTFNQKTEESVRYNVRKTWYKKEMMKKSAAPKLFLECLERMKKFLGYDVNTIIPHCVSTNNVKFIQYLMKKNVFDYNTCKNNGHLDEMKNNWCFGNVLNDFISKDAAKKQVINNTKCKKSFWDNWNFFFGV